MARLDPLLQKLSGNPGSELILAAGAVPVFRMGERRAPAARQPLSAVQIRALISELASPEVRTRIGAEGRGTFPLPRPGGAPFTLLVRDWGGATAVLIRAPVGAPSPAASPGPTSAAIPGALRPPPPTPGSGRVPPGAPGGRRAAGTGPVVAEGSLREDPVAAPSPPPRVRGSTAGMDRLFHLLVEQGGSDLHLTSGEVPMIRRHGDMQRLEGYSEMKPEELMALIEPIMPDRNHSEFLEIHDTDFAYEVPGLARFRANVFRDRKGPGGVFRTIPSDILTAEQLGLSQAIRDLCKLNKGLVLVTGPTGSGKSTTLCAMIDLINRTRSGHIITIEDPIEFVHKSKLCLVNQREVGVHTGSFKKALRAALREDPDILLVGEMRDLETIAIAIETAETGHLVFGTLHTTTAYSTVDRIIDQFPADQQEQIRVMLSESLRGVISQTLLKKVGGGRIAALEVLLVTPAISNLIREGKTFQIPSMMQTSKGIGMVLLNDALFELVREGRVEAGEALSKAIDKTGFRNMLQNAGIPVGA